MQNQQAKEFLSSRPLQSEMDSFLRACILLERLVCQPGNRRIKNHLRRHNLRRRQLYDLSELKSKRLPFNNMANLLIQAFQNLTFLYKQTFGNGEPDTLDAVPNLHIIVKICSEISENPHIDKHTAEYFALKFNMTEKTIQRNFKKLINTTLHHFVMEECMKKAFLLRQDLKMTLGDVAEELGYADKSGFIKVFKKWMDNQNQ